MIWLFLAGCHRHAAPLETFPGPEGRSCDGQSTVAVDVDPWDTIPTVTIAVGEETVTGSPGAGLAVVPTSALDTLTVRLGKPEGSVACELTGSGITRVGRCGTHRITLHTPPLCDSPLVNERLERVARPETANFTIARKFGERRKEPDQREAWNHQDPFHLAERVDACDADCETLHAIRDAMQAGLERLDGLDRFETPRKEKRSAHGAGLDWCAVRPGPYGAACDGPHPLRSLLLNDALLVDTRIRCPHSANSFLEIEMAHLQDRRETNGARHQTCGGRTLTVDAVDTLLTLTINGLDRLPTGAPFYGPPGAEAPKRGDGVDAPRLTPNEAFPWLLDP